MPYTAIAPNHDAFGLEQAAYLKSLLQDTGDPTANALNRINLMRQAQGSHGAADYLQALREANAQQLQGAQDENQKDAAVAYLGASANLAKEGVGGAVLPNAGNPYLRVSPDRLTQSDAQHQQGMQAEAVKNTGAGVKDLAEAGFAPPAAYIGGMITPSAQETPAPVSNYLSPGNKAKLEDAAAATEQAKAAQYRAVHNHEGANSAKDVTTYIIDPTTGARTPITTVSTTKPGTNIVPPSAAPTVPRYILDPKTHKVIPNPAYKAQ